MFRFTSLFYRAADYDMAVKIMINNGRYLFNKNQSNLVLFDWNGDELDLEDREFAVPHCITDRGWCGTLCSRNDIAGNNQYTQAWYYDGPSVDGQKTNDVSGATGWRGTRMLPYTTTRSTNNADYFHRTGNTTPSIPQPVWVALQSLFTSGGTTTVEGVTRPNYEDCKLSLTATDDTKALGGGKNYNVWPVENLNSQKNAFELKDTNYQIAQGRLDQQGCAYSFPNGTQEQILYNFDNITGSPILKGEEKSRVDFENRYDVNRTIPNTRYLRIKQGEIDITFSYVTELIKIQEGETRGITYDTNGVSYLGARITLWTGSYQGEQMFAGKREVLKGEL